MGKKIVKASHKKNPPAQPKISKSPGTSVSPNPIKSTPKTRSPTPQNVSKQKSLLISHPQLKKKTMLNGQNIKKPLTVIDPETEPIQIGQASANTKKKTLPSVKKTVGTNKKAPETLKKPTEVLKSIEIDHIANEPRERIRIKRLLPMAAHKSAMLPGNLKPKRDTYNVEEILDKRMIGRHFKYLIKWEGYPDEENSWEPKSNLPSQLVDEFEEKNKVLRTEKPVEVLDENKKDLSEGLNLGEEHQKLDQKGLIDVEKEVEKNETFKNNEHNVEGENLEQPEVIEEKGNKNQPMEIE